MPHAELVPFEGEDHYMIITRAREITERWRRFMQAQLEREATAATTQ